MKFKKYIWIVVCSIVLLLSSCKTRIEGTLDNMVKPVYIASIGSSGDILLRDSIGNVLLLNNNYYIAKSIIGGPLKTGDVLIPAPIKNNK